MRQSIILDLLKQTRDTLFKHAVERYWEQLPAINIKDNPDIYPKRRTGEKASATLAGDIVDLYLFATGLIDKFPKTVLGNTGKYIDFQRPPVEIKDRPSEVDSVDILRRQAELLSRCNEQEEQIRVLFETLEEAKKNYDSKIKSMEVSLGHTKASIMNLKKLCTRAENGSTDGNQPDQVNTNQCHGNVATGPEPQVIGTAQSSPCPMSGQDAVEHRFKSIGVTQLNPVPDVHGGSDTLVSKEAPISSATKGAESPNPKCQLGAPQATNAAPPLGSIEDFPPLPSRPSSPDIGHDRSFPHLSALDENEQWTTVTNGKSLRRETCTPVQSSLQAYRRPSKPTQRESGRSTPASSVLRGVKHEKTMVIYVSNIARDVSESDDMVKSRVRKYVKKKSTARIISVQVVRNRYSEDTVGCKLTIPISVQEILLAPGFWPEDVKCREWSRNRRPNERQKRDERTLHSSDRDRSGQDGWGQSDQDYPSRDDRYYDYESRDCYQYRSSDRHYSDNEDYGDWGGRDADCVDWWEGDNDVREHHVNYHSNR